MKRFICLLIALMLLMGWSVLAEDTGIQLIGGPQTEEEIVSLDDFKVGDTAVIDGFGEVTFTEAGWCDSILKYSSQTFYNIAGEWANRKYYNSGQEAYYLRLQFDILNTQKEPVNFYNAFSDPLCTFDEEYLFGGWKRQHINIVSDGHTLATLSDTTEGRDIATFYRGQYSVVITLPNDVYNRVMDALDPRSLSVTFMLGENEVTYNYSQTN